MPDDKYVVALQRVAASARAAPLRAMLATMIARLLEDSSPEKQQAGNEEPLVGANMRGTSAQLSMAAASVDQVAEAHLEQDGSFSVVGRS